jgi:multidrug efflux pump subunit AcrA (membrane-fusion protein)
MISPQTNDSSQQAASTAVDGNGSVDSKAFSRLPSRRRHRGNKIALMTGLVAGPLLLASAFLFWFRAGSENYNGPTAPVKKQKLILTVVERGSLESAKNKDIVCLLKAKSQGGVASTIKWLVDDGKEVKGGEPLPQIVASSLAYADANPLLAATLLIPGRGQGEKLIELDDSYLQDQYKTKRIDVDKAEDAWVKAEEEYKIQLIENETSISTSRANLLIARLNLEKYVGRNWQDNPAVVASALANLGAANLASPALAMSSLLAATSSDGDYQAALQDMLGKIEMAVGDKEGWLDRSSWSRRMYKLGFMSKAQTDSDQSRTDAADYALNKLQTDRLILERFTKKVNETDFRNKVGDAYRNLQKAEIQAASNLRTKDSARRSAKSVYDQEYARLLEISDDLSKCIMYAPQDGLVVYYIPENTKWGTGKQQLVELNGNVSEGQKLLQIPDLSQMQVNTRVHEAMVSHVHSGQRAKIRIEAFPGKVFQGHVTLVKNTASQADFLSSDVKVYQTIVSIDDDLSEIQLKPSMSAEVTIFADESTGPVLTIPIESVVGNIDMDRNRKCFVIGPGGQPQERNIVVGMNNDKEVEVIEGLKEGEKVVLNPTSLLTGERSKMKAAVPQTKQEKEGMFGGPKKGKGPKGGGAPGQKGPKGPGGPPGNGGDRQMWNNAAPGEKQAFEQKMKAPTN